MVGQRRVGCAGEQLEGGEAGHNNVQCWAVDRSSSWRG
jgi:hypothetical protein